MVGMSGFWLYAIAARSPLAAPSALTAAPFEGSAYGLLGLAGR
jgi:hypothetical protein